MLKSLMRKAGHFLIGLSEVPASVNGEADPFAEQVRRLAARGADGHSKLLAGSIQFLNLDEIQRETRMDRKAASATVDEIVQRAIRGNLSQDDTFVRHGRDLFLLCFASKDRDEIQARMQRIIDEIRKALAESHNDEFRVAHTVADVALVDAPGRPVIETIAETLRQVQEEAAKAARECREQVLRNASVRYRPVWSARRKIVALHRAVLDEKTGRQAIQRLSTLATIDDLLDLLFELDCLILGRAAAGLHDLVCKGGRTQLVVPVNFNSLTSRIRRTRYLKLCDNIPAAYRRFLLFEICNIPAGTTGSRILDLVVPLNAHAHGTFIEVSVQAAAGLVDKAGSAVLGVVTRADQFGHAAEEAQTKLGRFIAQFRARNLRVLLKGVNSAEQLRAAIAANVDCMEGTFVAETTRELKSVYSWQSGVKPA